MTIPVLGTGLAQLLARKGEAAPINDRLPPRNDAMEISVAGEEKSDALDLRSLIKRRRPIEDGNGTPHTAAVEMPPWHAAGGKRPTASLSDRRIMSRAMTEPPSPTHSVVMLPHQDAAPTSLARKRRQLTLRLWPEEFERLRTVASIAHTTYQEILASAAVIFLDHVNPSGERPNEEQVADGWQRLKDGAGRL